MTATGREAIEYRIPQDSSKGVLADVVETPQNEIRSGEIKCGQSRLYAGLDICGRNTWKQMRGW
jgi:hypothetical protein